MSDKFTPIMKQIFFTTVLTMLLSVTPALAQDKDSALSNDLQSAPNGPSDAYFDARREAEGQDYVLYDYIEFSLFDISELEIDDQTGNKAVAVKPVGRATGVRSTGKVKDRGGDELKVMFNDLPKYFYRSLRNAFMKNAVPITLVPKGSPNYSRPLKLAIKVKSLSLLPYKTDDASDPVQPFKLSIYGQIEDKLTGKVLLRFYDSAQTEFSLGHGQAIPALEKVSADLMGSFAVFLKTKY